MLAVSPCFFALPCCSFTHSTLVSEIHFVDLHVESPSFNFKLVSFVPNTPRPITIILAEPLLGMLLLDILVAKSHSFANLHKDPVARPKEAMGSADVRKMIPSALPSVAPPKVRPINVTAMTVLAKSVDAVVEMTIIVEVGEAEVPEPPLIETLGVALVDMKPEGYINEMELPGISRPPGVVVNENVTADAVLAAIRSVPRIENVAPVT